MTLRGVATQATMREMTLLVDGLEVGLHGTAVGTDPAVGKRFKGSARLDARHGIALGGIVDVFTDETAVTARFVRHENRVWRIPRREKSGCVADAY